MGSGWRAARTPGVGLGTRGGGNRMSVPFYGCPTCGWATTASLSTAVKAHQVASPTCAGELESIDNWRLPRRRG
jgi:hypothetical protein